MATYANATNPFLKVDKDKIIVANSFEKGSNNKKKSRKKKNQADLLMDLNQPPEILGDFTGDNTDEKINIEATIRELTGNNNDQLIHSSHDDKENSTENINTPSVPKSNIDVEVESAKHSKTFNEEAVAESTKSSSSSQVLDLSLVENQEVVLDDKHPDMDRLDCAIQKLNLNGLLDSKEDIEDDDNESPKALKKVEEETIQVQDNHRHQHMELIKKLRLQLRDLERYAYERGELEQVPASVLAERQTVILDSLKKKLALNLDKDRIEKLELEELKNQVDKEISELIDPLITKDHLLNQLKNQLTDLERYISHLHKTLGKSIGKRASGDCSCQLHGCSTPSQMASSFTFKSLNDNEQDQQMPADNTIMENESLPKTSRLIRGLMAQLICSDIKIQEAMEMRKDYSRYPGDQVCGRKSSHSSDVSTSTNSISTKSTQFHDSAVWNMHIDRVMLATDSLTNLFSNDSNDKPIDWSQVDASLVDSVVRRQLVPAIRDLLAYGLIDPNSVPRTTYTSFLFDPYYLISSLTCLPGSHSYNRETSSTLPEDKLHVWNVIEDYFNSRNEPEFKTSSVKTLSQSFNLVPSIDGPIKVTSKQGFLIAVDDIIERLSRCKPNGPESHLKMFIYTALNQHKLATWIRIVFRSKSIMKKFYHTFSFVSQPDKMEKFIAVIDALNQIEFKLNVDTKSVDPFVSAF